MTFFQDLYTMQPTSLSLDLQRFEAQLVLRRCFVSGVGEVGEVGEVWVMWVKLVEVGGVGEVAGAASAVSGAG